MFAITKPQGDPMLDLLARLERRMGRLFNEPFGAFELTPDLAAGAWLPLVDIFEENDTIQIVAELPGSTPRT